MKTDIRRGRSIGHNGLITALRRCSAKLPATKAFLATRDRLEPAQSGHGILFACAMTAGQEGGKRAFAAAEITFANLRKQTFKNFKD